MLDSLEKLDLKKATGLDEVSAEYVKVAAREISKPLTDIINFSFETNTFPDQWKSAKVIPIYKKGPKKSHCNNYRPISILNILSKIIEACP